MGASFPHGRAGGKGSHDAKCTYESPDLMSSQRSIVIGGGAFAGLGLALCRRIVEAQGGSLDFAHSPLGGLRVTVALPLAGSQP